ncbi:hypothetical protein Cni_G18564 [Canna indica]|uniref:F-box domain-containing protein n=1 Tax=Canna indica TaxID=4628 RepID=A0AAQ3QHP9_9LILI|nr:hypothetical protein Cni_G18564 [Canna indica]
MGRAACVCRLWWRLAKDERLWEAVCTRDWIEVPCGKQQLDPFDGARPWWIPATPLTLHPPIPRPLDPRPAAACPSLIHRSIAAELPLPDEAASDPVGQGRSPTLPCHPLHWLL